MNDPGLIVRVRAFKYPCYLVVHGPDRDYRTMYRREHPDVFRSGRMSTWEDALQFVEGAHYPGLPSKIDLIAITSTEGELEETVG